MVHEYPKRRRCYSEAEWDGAIAMYAGGASASEVASRFGMCVSAIYRRARALGHSVHTGRKRPQRPHASRTVVSADHYGKAVHDYIVLGHTAKAVCERYDLSVQTFRRKLCEDGLSKKKAAQEKQLPDEPSLDEIAAAAAAAWRQSAHAAQQAPEGAWATWLFQGGRGAGKTRAGAEWLAARAAATPDGVFALVGATMRDVREVMIDGPSGLMHLPNRAPPRFEVGRERLVFASGAVAYVFSSQEPRRLRGPQFDGAWADEFCAWRKPQRTIETLRFALRRGKNPQLVVTTTPKPIRALRALRAERSCVITQAASATNAANLSERFFETLLDLYGDTTLAAQELDGVMTEGQSALWKMRDLLAARGHAPAAFDRVVVAVDPPSGAGACGIVVAARRGRLAYVLDDRTVVGASPLGWAERAAEAARAFGAHEIVAEGNQGGAMVRTTLASADVRTPVRIVHARDAKRARAVPVAALYEKGRVVHCGAFVALEEEMMALGEAEMEGRLDRADALVWAITALLVDDAIPLLGPRISGF